MVNIFAREITDNLASLVQQPDDIVGKNKDKKMAGFLVLLTDDPDADEAKLTALAKKHGIKNIPLTIFDGVAGPGKYKISKDAEVTVMMWVKKGVAANRAFGKGGVKKADIPKIVADTAKILK